MARVTVEDCIDKVPNRFELVLLSAHRARMIAQGSPLTVERDNDKNPVVALREIADETIDKDDLGFSVISNSTGCPNTGSGKSPDAVSGWNPSPNSSRKRKLTAASTSGRER